MVTGEQYLRRGFSYDPVGLNFDQPIAEYLKFVPFGWSKPLLQLLDRLARATGMLMGPYVEKYIDPAFEINRRT